MITLITKSKRPVGTSLAIDSFPASVDRRLIRNISFDIVTTHELIFSSTPESAAASSAINGDTELCMLLISVQALHSLACPAHLVSSAQRLVILRRPLKRSFAVHTTSFRHSSSPLTSHTAAQLTQAKQQDRLFTLAQHLILAAAASCPLPAAAADVNYTPGQGADVVRNVGGLAYVGLLGFWLFKVVGRRIKRSTTEVCPLLMHMLSLPVVLQSVIASLPVHSRY